MSFNLPAGVTPAMIDRHFGGDDPCPDEGPYTVDVLGDLSFSQVGHFTIKGETSYTSYPTIPSHHKIKLSDPDIYECKPEYPGQQDFY